MDVGSGSPSHPTVYLPWTVLLVGGSSGTGKTTIASEVGRRLGIAWGQADDFRLVLQRLTTPAQQPDLHFFISTESVWRRPPEDLRDRLITVGRLVSRALEIVVTNHVATRAPLVLEGDGILPAFAVQRTFAGLDVGDQVRAVFLVEPDEDALLAAMLARGRGIDGHSVEEQRTQARASWLYGQWLRDEAERLGLPIIESCPGPRASTACCNRSTRALAGELADGGHTVDPGAAERSPA
jgi:2-phosphoglycerate kinase